MGTGGGFNREAGKNPGVNSAISDPPPDLRLKPKTLSHGDIMKSRAANY
jgi:hypothetical protein